MQLGSNPDNITPHVNACALMGTLGIPPPSGLISSSSTNDCHAPPPAQPRTSAVLHQTTSAGGESRTCRRHAADLQISEALLDQSVWARRGAVLADVGNIAKSEILFQTGRDPGIAANEVGSAWTVHWNPFAGVLWTSHHVGGRWVCRMDQTRARRTGPRLGTRRRPHRQTSFRRRRSACLGRKQTAEAPPAAASAQVAARRRSPGIRWPSTPNSCRCRRRCSGAFGRLWAFRGSTKGSGSAKYGVAPGDCAAQSASRCTTSRAHFGASSAGIGSTAATRPSR